MSKGCKKYLQSLGRRRMTKTKETLKKQKKVKKSIPKYYFL
jgi:hypothetical protein